MEAMVRGRIVLAPAITGIPEIVIPGKTGFLYMPGSMDDFVGRIYFLREMLNVEGRHATSRLAWMRHGARIQVLRNFDRKTNLTRFCDRLLRLIALPEFASAENWSPPNEDIVLQQVQLPV
jgi:glycosyltransferase involved in cell wall biosynthesis